MRSSGSPAAKLAVYPSRVDASFGRLLRDHRLAAGLTQEELAELAGLSVRAVSDMERARTTHPYPRSIRLLVVALGLSAVDAERLVAATAARDPGVRPGPRSGPRQLPAPVRNFVGRVSELRQLDDLLAEVETGPVVVAAVSGTAGVGKSALALHWAHRVGDRFPDGELYVNLRGFGPTGAPVAPADAVRDILTAFAVPAAEIPASANAQEALYRSVLAGKRVLLVADNARDADQVRPLLPAGPGCLVLVTSRNQLTGLVAAQGAQPVPLDVLSDAEAAELLGRRLGPERADPESVARLVALCARLPLALTVTAARAAIALPRGDLTAVADELRDEYSRLDALDGGEATASVRAVLSWSYAGLGPAAARLFRLLGVHPGPDISAPAAAALAGVGADHAGPSELAELGELVRASLLTRTGANRYGFHDLLRAYAAELAATTDDPAARRSALHRVLDHYLLTARVATARLNSTSVPQPTRSTGVLPQDLPTEDAALPWYEADRAVLHTMVTTAVAEGFDDHAWQLPAAMATFLHRRGHWAQNAELQEIGLAAARRLDDEHAQARMEHGVGHALGALGRDGDAQRHYEQALDLYGRRGDRATQAHIHVGLGALLDRQSRYREELVHCEQALAIYAELGDHRWQAVTLNNLGWCHGQLGHHEQSLVVVGQAIVLHQKLGDVHGEAAAWDSIGYAHHHLGRYDEALNCYEQALRLFRRQGHRFDETDVLTHVGDAHEAAGRTDAACDHWRQALQILDDLGHAGASELRARLRRTEPARDGGHGGGAPPH
jgi:tetratricopeptide (TPR) repeat protein/transcriptional regulator with XRE-family HTH domain